MFINSKIKKDGMEPFDVHILGCGSAKPTQKHFPTCQIVNTRGKLMMIDCGEAAQMQFARHKLNMNRLGHLFVSHNHGDHVFGLPGLISTMALLGRTSEFHIHGPQQIEEFLHIILKIYCEGIDYKVTFHPVRTRDHYLIYEDRSMEVWSIPLEHRIPCCGYLFREKPSLPHIRREMIDAFNIPISQINNIKAGASWTLDDGTVIPHEKLTYPAAEPRSYAYCSDTIYLPQLKEILKGTTLLFHEATYPHEMLARATETRHTTALQAATLARDAEVGKLCIGHYSARIKDENAHLAEAKSRFENTILAQEGLVIHL